MLDLDTQGGDSPQQPQEVTRHAIQVEQVQLRNEEFARQSEAGWYVALLMSGEQIRHLEPPLLVVGGVQGGRLDPAAQQRRQMWVPSNTQRVCKFDSLQTVYLQAR